MSIKGLAQAFQIEQDWASELASKHAGFGRLPKTDEDLLYDFEKEPGKAVQSIREKYGEAEAAEYVKYIQKLRGKGAPVGAQPPTALPPVDAAPAPAPPVQPPAVEGY